MECNLIEIGVPDDSQVIGKQLVNLPIPEGVLIVLVSREGEFIIPGGSTEIFHGDKLLVLSDEKGLPGLREIVEKKATKKERGRRVDVI